MRILHVTDVLTLGGAQGLALRLIDALQRRGMENGLCVVLTAERTRPAWWLPVEPVYLEFHGDYRRFVAWRRCVRQLEAVIRDFQPDVVHSVNWLADVTAARACRAAGVPHVAYLVDRRNWLPSPSLKHALRRHLTRKAFAGAGSRFMAVSSAVAKFVAEHLPLDRERIDVVRNSIEVAAFTGTATQRRGPYAERPVTVGMLSRLKEEKGHRLLFDAVGRLIRREVPLRVLIAGDGPLREPIKRRASQPEFSGRVSVVGLVDDARDFYRECDVFAVPSIHSEGLPTTILEAMASECAVVATDVGGANEVIESEVDGILVPPGDAAAFAAALQRVIGNAGLRTGLQRRAVERAEREFDVAKVAERVCEVFEQTIAEHPGSRTPIPSAEVR